MKWLKQRMDGLSDSPSLSDGRKRPKITFYLFQIYNSELENEFGNFEDWLCVFPLHRGKASEDEDGNEDEHYVGKYKVLFHLDDICATCGRRSL